jgi:TPR repeat protein
VRKRALLYVALASGFAANACSPGTPGSRSAGPPLASAEGGPSSSNGDGGGAPRACMHDAKDLTPCVEDCDRRLAFACAELASRAEHGDGTSRDLTRAVHLHERACELQDAASCVSAARMHAAGSGVPPSRAKQLELLVTACKLGDAHACSLPAKALASGNGITRDERRATELWERACAAGVSSACDAIDAGD